MEYLIGSFTTFVLIFLIYFIKKDDSKEQKIDIRYSQSHIFDLVSPLLPAMTNKTREKKNSQSYKHHEKNNVRVVIVDGLAYWIKENVFYKSEVVTDGVDSGTAEPVDTIGMSSVELDKMLFIMDRLREGLDNDSGSTRNQ
jgi:hypothetical protein